MVWDCVGDVMGVCVLCLYYDEWRCRCSCMESMSVSSCRSLCLLCILWQFSFLHDLQCVNAGRGCMRRPYGRGITPEPVS